MHGPSPVEHDGAGGPALTPHSLRALYRTHFCDRRKERQLLSSLSFFMTFAGVRGITHAIRSERGPFRNITPGGKHIHHMTFGIIGLLSVGYLWLLEIGINEKRESSAATSVVYGAGAALTLDEFALWLNLEDDYWTKQGRESIDAVLLFGSLLSMSVVGRGFLKDLARLARGIEPQAWDEPERGASNGRPQPASRPAR